MVIFNRLSVYVLSNITQSVILFANLGSFSTYQQLKQQTRNSSTITIKLCIPCFRLLCVKTELKIHQVVFILLLLLYQETGQINPVSRFSYYIIATHSIGLSLPKLSFDSHTLSAK